MLLCSVAPISARVWKSGPFNYMTRCPSCRFRSASPIPTFRLIVGAALNEAYAEGQYDLRIDYREPPPPPPLSPVDEAWLTRRLVTVGLRQA